MKCLGVDEFKDTQKPSVKSGFIELDKITHGWENGNLIVIASRPAMGKTAFGMSLLREIAVKDRIPTAFFSLEMSSKQVIDRFRRALSKVNEAKIMVYDNGYTDALNEEEKRRLEAAEKQMDIAPIYLDDSPSLSIHELYHKAIRLVSDFQIKLIIVDYIQLMNASGLQFSNRSEETACIIRELETLAKDLNIPIIAFSQLNRGAEDCDGIEGKRPKLRDLRGNTIEEDADVICFIYRPEYYRIYSDENGNDLHGKVEIIVAKNRNGNTGIVRLKFNVECSSFDNLDE